MSYNFQPFECHGDYFQDISSQSDHFEVFLRPYFYLYDPFYIYGKYQQEPVNHESWPPMVKSDNFLADHEEMPEENNDLQQGFEGSGVKIDLYDR